jgi:hypothetical protein
VRVDPLRYKSRTHQSELITKGTSQLQIFDHLRYMSNKYKSELIF